VALRLPDSDAVEERSNPRPCARDPSGSQ
jgi:hypothetical protein